uniref:Uncharacterized protein n=1 Tax=Glossina pallidipes TaxID=7398 RepID=A0A1A9ZJW1_GLOPL
MYFFLDENGLVLCFVVVVVQICSRLLLFYALDDDGHNSDHVVDGDACIGVSVDIFRCNYNDTFIVVAFLLAWEVRNVTMAAAAAAVAAAAAQVNQYMYMVYRHQNHSIILVGLST